MVHQQVVLLKSPLTKCARKMEGLARDKRHMVVFRASTELGISTECGDKISHGRSGMLTLSSRWVSKTAAPEMRIRVPLRNLSHAEC